MCDEGAAIFPSVLTPSLLASPAFPAAILSPMKLHRIWIQQCRATDTIRRRFGVKSALDYLIAEKLVNFAAAADHDPEFAEELPRFQAAV
jgi:hypothetical protein